MPVSWIVCQVSDPGITVGMGATEEVVAGAVRDGNSSNGG
jgi:hypothetical protein